MVDIVPATRGHAVELGRTMRAADVAEVMAAGLSPMDGVRLSLDGSIVASTALVDGKVAAMWGVVGALSNSRGFPWLLTAPSCELVSPLTFARIYMREARRMLEWFPLLENYVDDRYTAAKRVLRIAGFTLDEPQPYGTGTFRRFELRAK